MKMSRQPGERWVFKASIYRCLSCNYKIWSSSPGQYQSCTCGKCSIDQTEDYCRVGGDAVYTGADKEIRMVELTEEERVQRIIEIAASIDKYETEKQETQDEKSTKH